MMRRAGFCFLLDAEKKNFHFFRSLRAKIPQFPFFPVRNFQKLPGNPHCSNSSYIEFSAMHLCFFRTRSNGKIAKFTKQNHAITCWSRI